MIETCSDTTDVAVLKVKVETLQKSVDDIKDNHLKSIYDRLLDIEKKLAYYVGGGAVIVIIAQIIITKLI